MNILVDTISIFWPADVIKSTWGLSSQRESNFEKISSHPLKYSDLVSRLSIEKDFTLTEYFE